MKKIIQKVVATKIKGLLSLKDKTQQSQARTFQSSKLTKQLVKLVHQRKDKESVEL